MEESDPELEQAARDKLRGLLELKSFLERWVPVAKELFWVLSGKPDEGSRQKLLPEYCYNIFDLYGRSLFAALHTLSETIQSRDGSPLPPCKTIQELQEVATIHWNKFGSVVSVGQRGAQFLEHQVQDKIIKAGLDDLTKEEMKDIEALFIGPVFEASLAGEIAKTHPSQTTEVFIEAELAKLTEKAKNAVAKWEAMAYECGPVALKKFKEGNAKGTGSFLDAEGNLRGERKLKQVVTYQILLIAWPEIAQMIDAKPPKRMEDLWNWLAPFSHAGWIEIKELDQLVSLCRPLKLKLKKPGAPRKPRKC